MALRTIPPNQIIYDLGTPINQIALIIRGSVLVLAGAESFSLEASSLIGAFEPCGLVHSFSYITKTETTIYTYEYNDINDFISILRENEKLTPTIALSLIKDINALSSVANKIHNRAQKEYDKIQLDIAKYPVLCAKTCTKAKDYSTFADIECPNAPMDITSWRASYISTLAQKYKLMSPIYSLGSCVCIGFAIQALEFSYELSRDIIKISSLLDEFNKKTLTFKTDIKALNNEISAIENGEDNLSMPNFTNSLMQIAAFAEYDDKKTAELSITMDRYVEITNRTDTDDLIRNIRRQIAPHFYEIYRLIIKKIVNAVNTTEIPPIILMFLMFGFMEERVVDSEDIKKLYGYSVAYNYNSGKIIPMFEWLKKIYLKEISPSLNEFQQDYITYLRESVRNGDIRQEEMDALLEDGDSRLKYEIKNIFTLGNRMTFGKISMFVPIFDSQLRMLPLDKSYLSNDNLTNEINRIRDLDYSIFYRSKLFSVPDYEGLQFIIHEEQIPYIILMPNIGQNMILWQNIDGRIRNSSARMLVSSFFEENLSDSVTNLCGEYRWEVCKTDQGVRWTDITDPSLTAEYNDYLQFFKKNRSLTKDQKEKIKTSLKKRSNNYKKVFVSDYLSYIKYESAGNMRLLKPEREMLFKYCPFKQKTRIALQNSPQYEKLIQVRSNKTEQKTKPIKNTIKKMENGGETPPNELIEEISYLEM